ncbi:MAG TPA: hypothetical protein VFN74_11975 [Chloroflexota bacterium]|nr:hypothetical protein [Chloroflexota bacterium]
MPAGRNKEVSAGAVCGGRLVVLLGLGGEGLEAAIRGLALLVGDRGVEVEVGGVIALPDALGGRAGAGEDVEAQPVAAGGGVVAAQELRAALECGVVRRPGGCVCDGAAAAVAEG